MYDELSLQTKADIPFIEGQLIIHQPSIREIALIGEDTFNFGCSLLNFSKETFLSAQDKNNLADKTNFDVLLSIINDKQNNELKTSINNVKMVLALLFPEYTISFTERQIMIIKPGEQMEVGYIDNSNFDIFQKTLKDMFCLSKFQSTPEYKPAGPMAQRIADKLNERHKKLSAQKDKKNEPKESILSRYISILAIGLKKDINKLSNYSVYQLHDEFERFQLKQEFDLFVEQKLAGAKDVKEVDNWMKNLHSDSTQKEKFQGGIIR